MDFTDLELVRSSIKPNTKVVYFETPVNPTLKIYDIEEISNIAHSKDDVMVVVID